MSKKEIRAGIYARVSTGEQTVENQLIDLRAAAAQRGWTVVEEYTDKGISGTKGRDKRPAFDKLLKDAGRGRINLVCAWKLDRIGRTLSGIVESLEVLRSGGVDLYLHREQIDGSTPMGRAMLSMSGVFAELERENLIERVNAGIARARVTGTKSGKAFGRPTLPADKEQAVRDALAAPGRPGFHKIAALTGVSTGSVQRISLAMRAEAAE